MFDKIRVVEENPRWQRYEIKTDSFTIEQMIPYEKTFKSLRIYDVGHQALEKIAVLFNLKIKSKEQSRWVSWEDPNTHIEVVIFE
jgi:hypothetical protein